MRLFSHLDQELKKPIILLGLGTFLEYFDLFLYAHMAVLLNGVFFPPAEPHTQSFLAAFAFCSSFIFRPFGAMLFGYLGDTYGRKLTIVITTFMMAITCLVMANAPTYDQIGIAAAWIVTLCRILQGMSSMGEIIGAQLFLTEATPLPARFPVVGLINLFADLGGLFALSIAVLATSYGFNWRIAFWIGAGVAIVGSVARTALRESPEYADARKRMQKAVAGTNQKLDSLKKMPIYNEPVNPKTTLAYFLIKCSGPTFLYFVYFYITIAFKDVLKYNTHQILVHNLLVAIVQVLRTSIVSTYLSNKIHPLKILTFMWRTTSLFILFLPWLLNHITAPWQLFLIQSFMITFSPTEAPAAPIFFKNFPVFKRFSYISILFALAYAVIYAITSYGLTYLIAYWGYWGLLVLIVPVLTGYGYGLHHFKLLEKAAGRYPKLHMWKIAGKDKDQPYEI